MVRIKFIGTGSLEGSPSPLCNCNVCNASRKKGDINKRFRSSIYIEFSEKESIIIDCSPDFKEQIEMFKIPIQNIFITHGHIDHFLGLGELSYLKPLYNINPKIYGKIDVIEYCKQYFGFLKLDFKEIEDNYFYIENNKIELIPVEHAKNTSTTALFFKNILIIPEIYKITENEIEKLKQKKIECLIIDGAYYKEALYKDHFTIQDAIKFGKEINANKTIITNIWHNTKLHNELCEEFKEEAIIAYDGFELEF